MIKRLTGEVQDLRRLLDEARGETQTRSILMEGEAGAILIQKNVRIEELSASVARLEEELARAPAAGKFISFDMSCLNRISRRVLS